MIETERLVLRPHGAHDFADLCRLWGDAVVTRHIGGKGFSPEEVWMRLLRYAGTWSLFGYGFFAIHDKATRQFVGDVGFIEARRDIEPAFGERPEFGYALLPWAHGKGMALEASRAVMAWEEQTLGPREIVCMIEPENHASLKLAAALGFAEYGRSQYKGTAITLLSRPAIAAIR